MMEMIEIENRLRARLVWAVRAQLADTKWALLCRCRAERAAAERCRWLVHSISFYMVLCLKFSCPFRGGLWLQKYEDGLFCGMRRKALCPLNRPEGDWKMVFICHTPHADSNYSISLQREKWKWLRSSLWRSDGGSLNGCGRNGMKGRHMIKLHMQHWRGWNCQKGCIIDLTGMSIHSQTQID